MNNYEKPMILANEDLTEGVYAASGCIQCSIQDESYEGGDGNKYRFAVYMQHTTTAHTNTAQKVVVQLNAPVNVVDGNAQGFYVSGDGTDTLTFVRNSSMNACGSDVGMFNVVVTPVSGESSSLKVLSVQATDEGYIGN